MQQANSRRSTTAIVAFRQIQECRSSIYYIPREQRSRGLTAVRVKAAVRSTAVGEMGGPKSKGWWAQKPRTQPRHGQITCRGPRVLSPTNMTAFVFRHTRPPPWCRRALAVFTGPTSTPPATTQAAQQLPGLRLTHHFRSKRPRPCGSLRETPWAAELSSEARCFAAGVRCSIGCPGGHDGISAACLAQLSCHPDHPRLWTGSTLTGQCPDPLFLCCRLPDTQGWSGT